MLKKEKHISMIIWKFYQRPSVSSDEVQCILRQICFEKCGSMVRAPTTDKDSLVRVLERGGIYLRGMCDPATTNRKGMIPPLSASGFGQTPMKRKTTAQLDKDPIPVKMKGKSEKLLKEVKKLLIEERKLEDQIWCLDASKMEIVRCSEVVDLPERKLKRTLKDAIFKSSYVWFWCLPFISLCIDMIL